LGDTIKPTFLIAGILASSLLIHPQSTPHSRATESTDAAYLGAYLGFDRNDFPGDANLKILRRSFSYTGYWLNNPPGAKTNSWRGKRQAVEDAGFGFLVIFNGRTYDEIKSAVNATINDAVQLGESDAKAAILSARADGFPPQTVIFLDQEQGGRLLPEQRAYLHAWVDGVNSAHFQAGVYCSGISFKEGSGTSIVTADDIRQNADGRKIKYWVVNDSCPPSPGCTLQQNGSPDASGISFADVWQFAQSPRRPDVARACTNYSHDKNCYPPGIDPAQQLNVDLDVATSPDPSQGRTRH
jgi:Domain of unknown function (DUF1906)